MKKLNSKGFSHHLVMFAILAIVLGAMGFAGYRVYQNRNIDAKADSWQTVKTISLNRTVAKGSNYGVSSVAVSGTFRVCASLKNASAPSSAAVGNGASGGQTVALSSSFKTVCSSATTAARAYTTYPNVYAYQAGVYIASFTVQIYR